MTFLKKKTNNSIINWFLQKITAIIIGIYLLLFFILFLKKKIFSYKNIIYISKKNLFKIFFFFLIINIIYHTILGINDIFEDYLKNKYILYTFKIFLFFWIIFCLKKFFFIFWKI